MRDLNWYCPAVDREIGEGLCREYRKAGQNGPEGTQHELERWLQMTHRYADIDEFHRVCAVCAHGEKK